MNAIRKLGSASSTHSGVTYVHFFSQASWSHKSRILAGRLQSFVLWASESLVFTSISLSVSMLRSSIAFCVLMLRSILWYLSNLARRWFLVSLPSSSGLLNAYLCRPDLYTGLHIRGRAPRSSLQAHVLLVADHAEAPKPKRPLPPLSHCSALPAPPSPQAQCLTQSR